MALPENGTHGAQTLCQIHGSGRRPNASAGRRPQSNRLDAVLRLNGFAEQRQQIRPDIENVGHWDRPPSATNKP
eukprot:2921759-Lingulodinium_polyedra.AAC.1